MPSFLLALSLVALAAGLGTLLYGRFVVLRRFLIQPALLAGVCLFFFGPDAFALLPGEIYGEWKTWPGVLISFLFAGLLLGEAETPAGADAFARPVLQQSVMVWFIALGQLALGFVCALGLEHFTGLTPLIAHIIEIGWTGGHGSAGAMTSVMRGLNQPDMGDLSLFSATVGLVWGGVSGIVIVNLLRGNGPVAQNEGDDDWSPGKILPPAPAAAGENENALFVALLTLVLVVGAGFGVRAGVAWFFASVSWPDAVAFTEELPVFFLALTIGALIRRPLRRAKILNDGVAREIRRLSAVVLEVLIIAAVASLSLRAVFRHPGPFLLLMVVAAIWCILVLFYFSPRMLPGRIWRELGLLNYGMATGNTALGLYLLRSYRGHIPPGTARVYGLAAPFSAPFVGGGVLSLLLPQFTARGGGPLILAGLCAALVVLYLVSRALAKRSP